mgnify:CR=1 FL=1
MVPAAATGTELELEALLEALEGRRSRPLLPPLPLCLVANGCSELRINLRAFCVYALSSALLLLLLPATASEFCERMLLELECPRPLPVEVYPPASALPELDPKSSC